MIRESLHKTYKKLALGHASPPIVLTAKGYCQKGVMERRRTQKLTPAFVCVYPRPIDGQSKRLRAAIGRTANETEQEHDQNGAEDRPGDFDALAIHRYH